MCVTKKGDTPMKPALVTRPAKNGSMRQERASPATSRASMLREMPRRASLVTGVVFLGEWVGLARLPSELKN